MYLINFAIQESIKIEVIGQTFDLHNHFDLQEYTYNINKKYLELRFTGTTYSGASTIEADLKLIFKEVDFLRIIERDIHEYADEDSWQCLSQIGFFEDVFRSEIFGSNAHPIELTGSRISFFDKETCMVIQFMSGIQFYIASKTAEVELHQRIAAEQ